MAMTGMRSFAKSKWALVIFGVLIVAFGFGVGVNDPFQGVMGGGFVQAGDRSVGARDANRVLNQQIERIRQETGEAITQRDAAQRGLVGQIVAALRNETVSLAWADKVGIKASASAVTDILAGAPRFKDALGRVNPQAVAAYANEQNMSVSEFENDLRDSLTLAYIQQAVTAGITAPRILSDPMAAFLGEKRVLAVARLTNASMPPPKEPTEAELDTYYKAHAAEFAVPELRQISIVTYSPDDFLDKVAVTDAQIKSAYDRRIREFSTPETREITQIAGARNDVQGVVDTIKQGVDIAEAVKRGTGVTSLDLTVKPADLSNKEYSDAVFGVPPGEVFGPVQVGESWIAFKVNKITPGVATPLEQVSAQIRTELARTEAVRLYNTSAEDFANLVGGGASLEEISTEIGAPVLIIGGVDRNGADPVRGQNPLLATHRDALAHMFEAKPGETSEVIEGDNQRAVMRLDAVTPTRNPPLAEVRERVHQKYMGEEAVKAAQAVADGVVAKVKAGAKFEQAAKDAKMAFNRTPLIARTDLPRDASAVVLERAFRSPLNEAAVIPSQEGEPWIVQVEQIVAHDAKADAQLSDALASRVRDTIANDMQEVFARGVQSAVNVKLNEKAIQDYIAGFTREEDQ